MTRHRNTSGFTLIELMVVVAIIAIISGMALPKLMSARLSANEAAAIATLRSISTAQAQIVAGAFIDSDSDGAGEHAYFGELAGTAPLRVTNAGVPAAGVPGTDNLVPAVISSAFGQVSPQSLVARAGYYFQIWLPGATAGGLTPGIPEMPLVGGADPSNFPDPNNCEVLWCCYAWPMVAQQTGNRVFFINQEGDLKQFPNRTPTPYTGTTKMPLFDEAYKTPGDMSSGVRVGVAGGNDGTIWVPIQ